MPTRPSPEEVAALVRPSLVVLEGEGGAALGACLTEGGVVATTLGAALRVVAAEALLADGRRAPITQVAGMDPRRDVILLRLGARDMTPVALGREALAEPGTRAFAAEATGLEAHFLERTLTAVQQVNDALTLYVLSGTLPDESTGGPLVDVRGQLLGLVGRARGPHGPIGIGSPQRYLTTLLAADERLPADTIKKLAGRAGVVRRIPDHPLSMLAGSSPEGMEEIMEALVGAIQVGAPAYNAGDAEGCYRVYADVAQKLIVEHGDCPGAQQALGDGLARAAALEDPDARAWALRDAFDGLLTVTERWLALPADARPAQAAGGKRVPN